MNPVDSMHFENAIPPGAIKDNAAFTSRVIDTVKQGGAKQLVFLLLLGATDITLATVKVMESDEKTDATTLGGSPTEVIDVSDNYTLPGPGDDDQPAVVRVPLQGPHKRYMQLQVTAGNGSSGTYLSAGAFFTNVGVPTTNLGALFVADA